MNSFFQIKKTQPTSMELDVISFKKQLAPIRVKEDSTMDGGVDINTSHRASLSSNSLVYASQLLAFYRSYYIFLTSSLLFINYSIMGKQF
jgi:hypothetical protein